MDTIACHINFIHVEGDIPPSSSRYHTHPLKLPHWSTSSLTVLPLREQSPDNTLLVNHHFYVMTGSDVYMTNVGHIPNLTYNVISVITCMHVTRACLCDIFMQQMLRITFSYSYSLL